MDDGHEFDVEGVLGWVGGVEGFSEVDEAEDGKGDSPMACY